MTMRKENEIYQQIADFVGMKNGYIDNTPVYFSVKEMYGKVGGSVYRREPMGRYQINVPSTYGGRDKIFRTKKDGSFNMLDVADAIKSYKRYRAHQIDMSIARESNTAVAAKIVEEAKATGVKMFISSYMGNGTHCAPSSSTGYVNVQIDFGDVKPEVARKIFEFVKSMEAV